jgi:hypothetical protein
VKLWVRCGELDGGKQCGLELDTIDVPGFPGPVWFRGGNYERLRPEERFFECPQHGPVQIHETDLLNRSLKTGRDAVRAKRRVLMATRPTDGS